MRIMTLSWLGSYGASLEGISKIEGTYSRSRMKIAMPKASSGGKEHGYKGKTYGSSVRINKMSDMLRHPLRDKQNCNVFPDLSEIEKGLFNFLLIGCRLVTDVKIRALATSALSNSWKKIMSATQIIEVHDTA
jgi:hypothetical protein